MINNTLMVIFDDKMPNTEVINRSVLTFAIGSTMYYESILNEEINELSNEGIFNTQNSDSIDLEAKSNIEHAEISNLEETINDKVFEQNQSLEIDNTPEVVLSPSLDIEKTNDTSVRRLSLFDTLTTENKSGETTSENEAFEKTEPVLASLEEKIEENASEDNNSSFSKNEEFGAEETDSSEIDDEFNQETEEELFDIPTFLRRQAN